MNNVEIAVIGYDYGPTADELNDHIIFVDMMDVEGDDVFTTEFCTGIERVHCLKERRNLYAQVSN